MALTYQNYVHRFIVIDLKIVFNEKYFFVYKKHAIITFSLNTFKGTIMTNEQQDEFEHNDGLGDLLREREKLEFSWSKTVVVLSSLFAVVVIGIYFVFNFGKSVIKEESIASFALENTSIAKIDDSVTPASSTIKDSKIKKNKPAVSTAKNDKPVAKTTSTVKKDATQKKSSTAKATIKLKSTVKNKAPKKRVVKQKPIVKSQTAQKAKTRSSKKLVRNTYPYKVITGTFSNQKNAQSHLESLKSIGVDGFIKKTKTSLGAYFRVQVGAYKTQKSAKLQQAKLQAVNIDSYIYQE